nr:signal recognition particle-docking protein FtsY [Roseospirillum parvum]
MPRPEAPAPEVAPAPPAQAGDKAPLEPPVQTPVQEPVQEKTVPAPAAPLPPSDAPPPAEAAQEGPKDGETPKEGEAAKEGEESEEEEQKSWLRRLFDALARSSGRLAQGIVDLFAKRKLDDDTLQELEDLLITADMGVETSARLCTALAKERFGKHVPPEEVKAVLAEEIADILEPVAKPLEIDRKAKPHVVLVVGVNGAGKTTTIGKLARYFKRQGRTVSMAAGDTFRAAAVEQLKVWGGRTACHVFARETGADAASLAFDAYTEAQNYGDDVLLIDTAGRLQNKVGLMEELKKIVRVLRKVDESAPHTCLLVLDATVGQNAHSQVETFRDMIEVNGLVMTKLDGTARGGVIVALADRFGLPIHALGVGEKIDDLRPFKARDFANSLMGLDEKSAGLLGGGKE